MDFVLVARWFLFVNLVACWFCLFVKLLHWFFSSWNWFSSCSLFGAEFVRETFCMLIFVRETCCMFIFLFVKLVHWFFSFWNWFCSWSCFFMLILFLELVTCWLLFVKLFDHSLPETWTLIFLLVKLILFIELVACWTLFVKLAANCFFCSWN